MNIIIKCMNKVTTGDDLFLFIFSQFDRLSIYHAKIHNSRGTGCCENSKKITV
jgi:hypothetical protein